MRIFPSKELFAQWKSEQPENIQPDRTETPADCTPSILEQTDWPCGIFHFGKAESKGVDYFNCGAVQKTDGLWLIARRGRFVPGLRFGLNDLIAFLLDNKKPVKGIRIQLEQRFPDEQYEDPRAIQFNGKTYVSCCNFVWTNRGWTGAHQIISEVSNDWLSIKRHDPDWGKNGINIGRNTGHEKNWIWFFRDGLPHMVYQASPHCVVRFDEKFDPINCWFSPNDLQWEYGEVRGGTPPVRVGDEYWTFFHSSTVWTGTKKQYHMGAYAFESKQPFRITRITSFPILSGSRFDPYSEPKPIVVFPNGSLFNDGKWFVTFGVNDLKCAWIEIPHAELEKLTFPL